MKINPPKLTYIKSFKNHNGELFTIEKNNNIKGFKRVFYIKANNGALRGNHAHKKCIQYLICLAGKIEVRCVMHKLKKKYLLNSPKKMLKINPYTWVTQKYLKKDSVLLCLCSDKYDEKDYIRNFQKYTNYFSK
tara:strand:+ start:965 stop:1366 length:402 start_codon:yes stop_codon:yes gene_type:complete